MRETEAPEREHASSDSAARAPTMVDGRSLTRPTRPATRNLRGCAQEGCLEVAKLGSDHCPLHGWPPTRRPPSFDETTPCSRGRASRAQSAARP